jgi:molybdopterin synthase catalytic subunit
MTPLFAISTAPLDVGALTAAVLAAVDAERPAGTGAVATFVGVVRGDHLGRRVTRLAYEAYEPLARRALERIAGECSELWPGVTVAVHHRVGALALGEASVVIVAAAPHRVEAFGCCRYAIERVKQIVPVWKHEHFEGGEAWVEGATAHPDDEAARAEARRRACA